ncbi:transcriptional regulator [Actinomadura sp. NBRC 104425]|uniref:helix-turn-helix domain-containing protein n=1 Tax=Actinomadura sp. NBRC 104425 TaxID=3032204 RepID=UPI0024A45867|nr:helix-turn-helix domain-containing protein [Actinomadura sp. NBRC 104425]GLZ15604.1 transcriptional regulator [Actinomadura sp. NBRC 104425]
MPATAPPVISRATTEEIAPRDRIAYWEDYNRRALVGLSCTSYSERGLLARQTNFELGGVRLADISGNAHAIERSPQMARSVPKDSVFVTLLVKGDAVFMHENGCLSATAGELVVYDTRRPYLFGFSGMMRQFLVDIPRTLFVEQCMTGGVPAPMLFGRGTAREGELVASLRTLLAGMVAGTPGGTRDDVLELIRLLGRERSGDRSAPGTYQALRIVAEDYIERHLHDPRLTPSQIAGVLGVSVRHLGRVFEPTGTTPSRYITERRLRRAYEQLTGSDTAGTTIADVAYRWGFSSQAHFARLFRTRYGCTPSEARARRT